MEMGPGVIVAKWGEYGAALFSGDGLFAIPGYLLEDVRDPMGGRLLRRRLSRLPRQPTRGR